MPDRELLEDYPLYRKKTVQLPVTRYEWPRPAINAHCSICGSSQTFNCETDLQQTAKGGVTAMSLMGGGDVPWTPGLRLTYECASCGRGMRHYLILVEQETVPMGEFGPAKRTASAVIMKVGQYPPIDISGDPAISSRLGAEAEYLKKGLVCESQGYGIGAFAYYRRIVERLIDGLLEDIASLIDEEDRTRYDDALQRVRKSHVAAEKIEIVVPLLPAVLRPGGANPLSLLHTALSKGVHELSDEECLDRAVVLRDTLTYLVHQVRENRESADRYKESIRKLLKG